MLAKCRYSLPLACGFLIVIVQWYLFHFSVFCYDFGFSIFTCFIIENLFCCKCFFHKMHGLVLTLSKTWVLHETLNVVGKNWGIIWNFKCRGKNSGLTVVKKKNYFILVIIYFFLADCIFLRLNSSLIASNLLSKGKIEKRGLKWKKCWKYGNFEIRSKIILVCILLKL